MMRNGSNINDKYMNKLKNNIMNKSEKIAYEYLTSKYDSVFYKNKVFYADGKKFRVKRAYGKTIWMYETELEKLRQENINLLVVSGNKITIITHDKLECNKEINHIYIKCPKKVKISLDPDVRNKLLKYHPNPNEAIKYLISVVEKENRAITVHGLANEMLPVVFAVTVVKNNRYEYIDAVNKLLNNKKDISGQVLRDLVKYKIVYYDETNDEVKLLSWFKDERDTINGKIRIYVAYNTDFCRMYCSNAPGCSKFLKAFTKNETKWFGNVFEFNIDEFIENSTEELIGKCIMRCME